MRDQPLAKRDCCDVHGPMVSGSSTGSAIAGSAGYRRAARCGASRWRAIARPRTVKKALTGRTRRRRRRAAHNRRRPSPRTAARRDRRRELATKAADSGRASRSMATAQPLASAMRRASSSRPSDTSIIAWACGASACPARELGNRAAIDVDQRPRRLRRSSRKLRKAGGGIAERADQPQRIAGFGRRRGRARARRRGRSRSGRARAARRREARCVSPPISGRP